MLGTQQKNRRRPAVLSFTVGVDALDFALALDSGRYGSLMSLVGASRARTYRSNLTLLVLAGARTYRSNLTFLKTGRGSRKIK